MESGERIRGKVNHIVAVASSRDGYDDLEDSLDWCFSKSELEVEKMMMCTDEVSGLAEGLIPSFSSTTSSGAGRCRFCLWSSNE